MFVRLGIIVLLLGAVPALVLAGGTDLGNPQYDEFGSKIDSQKDDTEAQEGETDSPPPEPVFPKMFDVTMGGGFGYGFPIGGFYSDLDSGPLYFGEIRIAVSAKSYIKFGYRKMNIFKDSQGVSDIDGTYLGTVDLSLDVHAYVLSMGWLSSPNKMNKLRMYGEFGAGYANHVLTARIDSISLSDDEGKFVIASQIGVIVPFSNGPVGLDVGGSILWKTFTGEPDEGWGALLAAHVGLVFLIGGGQEAVEPSSDKGL